MNPVHRLIQEIQENRTLQLDLEVLQVLGTLYYQVVLETQRPQQVLDHQ
jgi:hypothetical protein